MSRIEQNYQIAKEIYAEKGVDTDKALKVLKDTPISVHCWQIDDLTGFENPNSVLSGGIAAFGNAPGKPADREEFVAQLDKALKLIPGAKKLALHAVYLDNKGKRQSEMRYFLNILPDGWTMPRKER